MSATQVRQEEFKPIAIARGTGLFSRLVYAVRQAIDFQLLTCLRFLAPHLARVRGKDDQRLHGASLELVLRLAIRKRVGFAAREPLADAPLPALSDDPTHDASIKCKAPFETTVRRGSANALTPM